MGPFGGTLNVDHEAFWSTRYRDAGEEYLFGTTPARFLAHRAQLFEAGHTALLVADGEGRNSVWLAEQGLDVTAVEISSVAIAKARKLAAGKGVNVRFELGDLLASDWPPPGLAGPYDWVLGVFIQFTGPAERARLFRAMQDLTAPGGRILLLGYTPKQLEYRTGGPSAIENLYTPELLKSAFADWHIEELVEYEDEIAEGAAHKGRSALIGMVARKA